MLIYVDTPSASTSVGWPDSGSARLQNHLERLLAGVALVCLGGPCRAIRTGICRHNEVGSRGDYF